MSQITTDRFMLASLNSLTGDVGGAISPTGGNINIVGSAPISVVGNPATSTLTIDTDGTVAFTYTTDAGNATPALDIINVLGGLNVSTVGAGNTVTVNLSGTTDHAVQVGNAGGSLTSLGIGLTGQVLKGNLGADPSWGAVDLTVDVTGLLPVGSGGTGVGSVTDHSLIVGSGTSAVTELGVASDGELVVGVSGADPVLSTLTAGTNINIANAAGSITITAVPSGGGYTWTDVTASTQAMAADNGYIANRVAGNVTFTLPATIAVGEVVAVAGSQNGWSIAQNAGQTVHFLGQDTTAGVGGSLTSTTRYDCIDLICVAADTDFVVRSSVGNITVV